MNGYHWLRSDTEPGLQAIWFLNMRNKHILRNFLSFIAALVLYILGRLIYLSCKKEFIISREVEDLQASRKPVIYAFWHGRMFTMGFIRPKHRQVYTIISRHGDGQLITNVMMMMGIKAVRGSTNRNTGEHKKGFPSKDRGGTYAIRRSLNVLEEGHSIAITPDGPKGPRFVYKPNSLKIAAMANAPIIPITFSAEKAKIFNTWDRFLLPKPFSRIKIKYGAPKFIPNIDSDEEVKRYGKELQDELNRLTTELDEQFNIDVSL